MTVVEKIRQLLALAASTTFAGERDSALTKARLLFNKHQVADARLRWELLTALGQEVGPEPSRQGATTATAEPEAGPGPGPAWWEQAEAAEAEWFARWQRRQQAAWAEEQKREREAERARRRTQTRTQQHGGGRRTKRRVQVRRHWSRRTFVPIEDYTRTIVSRPVTFTCQRCDAVVTQQRFPSPTPAYCGEACAAEARREQTRARVRRFREARRAGTTGGDTPSW